MTVVAIWCRHKGDNVIGYKNGMLWHIESDTKKFWQAVSGQNVVVGRKTYELMPCTDWSADRVYVLTNDENFSVYDEEKHVAVNSYTKLKTIDDDLFIAGGAEVYRLFFTGIEKLKPHIVVDCVYDGVSAQGEGMVDITASIKVLEKDYRCITSCFVEDDVATCLWVKKGEFVEQSVLKRLWRIFTNDVD